MTVEQDSLYTRLGGYDAIYVFAAEALKKAMAHPAIGHIWAHMPESSFFREHINFVDFLSEHWGGNVRYRGRDKPAVVGSPSYRDVVLAHPEIDVTKGMKSVGVMWPNRRAEISTDEVPGA